jgi:hypothetical protein
MNPLLVSTINKAVDSFVPILSGIAIVTALGSLWLFGAGARLRQRHELLVTTP